MGWGSKGEWQEWFRALLWGAVATVVMLTGVLLFIGLRAFWQAGQILMAPAQAAPAVIAQAATALLTTLGTPPAGKVLCEPGALETWSCTAGVGGRPLHIACVRTACHVVWGDSTSQARDDAGAAIVPFLAVQ
jgi:hypothetical protein